MDQPISPLADVYCFGLALLEIATLKPPYSECTNHAQMYYRIQNHIKPVSLDEISNQELKNIISACLAPVKERPTVSELMAMDFWKHNEELDKHQVQVVS